MYAEDLVNEGSGFKHLKSRNRRVRPADENITSMIVNDMETSVFLEQLHKDQEKRKKKK